MARSALQPAVACAEVLAAVRAERPRVHCITNAVVQEFTANALLAFGATPSLTVDPNEVTAFVASADGLLINLGTLDDARREAIDRACRTAGEHDIPWVMDPVLIDRAPGRRHFARALAEQGPAVVRGNATEIGCLARDCAEDPAEGLARALGLVVARTGRVDRITDGTAALEIDAGHPFMDRVTGVGCVASALVAACAAVTGDRLLAAATALLALGTAGARAGSTAVGPGSFHAGLLDELYRLEPDALARSGALSHLFLEERSEP